MTQNEHFFFGKHSICLCVNNSASQPALGCPGNLAFKQILRFCSEQFRISSVRRQKGTHYNPPKVKKLHKQIAHCQPERMRSGTWAWARSSQFCAHDRFAQIRRRRRRLRCPLLLKWTFSGLYGVSVSISFYLRSQRSTIIVSEYGYGLGIANQVENSWRQPRCGVKEKRIGKLGRLNTI